MKLFTPPTAYQSAYQQPTGSRFGGDALYNGENRDYGALITYYLKVEEKKKEDTEKETDEEEEENDITEEDEKDEAKIKWDSIYLKVYDGDRLIRTLKQKTPDSTGFHKTKWFMDEKGADRPLRKIKKQDKEPGGVTVKPGKYKLVMQYGDQTSETMIEVKSDPRLQVSQKSINEVYTASKNLEKMRQTAADAVKQLVESKEIASKYQKELKELDKKKFKDQIKRSKDITKKIDSVIAIYIGKEDKRQGITRNPEVNVMQRMGTALRYVQSRQNGLTATENTLIQQAKEALQDALNKTNEFFIEDWKSYREEIEKLKASPFKETKSFNLE